MWLFVVLALAVAGALLVGRRTIWPRVSGDSAPVDRDRESGSAEEMYPGLPDNHLLTEGPVCPDGTTLRDWLRYKSGDNAWHEVVADFYDAAAADPEVASYFHGVDMDALQRHFLASIVMVTGHGVSVGVVRRMRLAHDEVVNAEGKPINEAIWDKVVSALAGVLTARGVPGSAIGELAATIEPIKAAVVVTGRRQALA